MSPLLVASLAVFVIVAGVAAAPSVCDNSLAEATEATNSAKPAADFTKILQTVQCTLQKSNWVAELEKEAKRLEENAKQFGIGLLSTVSNLVAQWTVETDKNSTEPAETADQVDLTTENAEEAKCGEDQEMDEEGNCKDAVSS